MATIVGGIAVSHTPAIAFAFDTQKADDPNFALGFGETFAVADEGGGPRPLPAIKGHPALRGRLTEEEKDMLRRLDWRALIRYGVIFFIPFGGAKESGLGRQYSVLTLKSYMEPEVVSVAKQ